jgi:excisionase family DNA binding protein
VWKGAICVRSLRDWAEYLEKQERRVKEVKAGADSPPGPDAKSQAPQRARPAVAVKPAEESITQPKPGTLPGGRVIPPALRRDRGAEVPEFSDYVSDLAGPPAVDAAPPQIAQKVAARRPTDLEPWVVVPAESPAAGADEERPAAEAVPKGRTAAQVSTAERQPELFTEPKPRRRAAKAKKPAESAAQRPKGRRPRAAAAPEPIPVQTLAEGPAEIPGHLSALLEYEGREAAQPYYKRAREQGAFSETRLALIQRLLDPPLTLEEAARLLNVCPTTVRRYTNKGLLNHHRTPGNQRRFRLSDVIGFMAEQGRLGREAPRPDA